MVDHSELVDGPRGGVVWATGWVLLAVVLLLGAFLYSYHAFQFFGDDDEGGYAYAAWRISEGDLPYRDFLTPQMPAFLYEGGLIVRVFGRSFIPLRLATMLVVLAAACLLYRLNAEVYGRAVGILSTGLFLVEANVLRVARFFRPEAPLMLFELAGLYVFVLGEKRKRSWYFWVAGALFGLAILSKLFGVLPLAGCYLFLLYAWWRERRPFGEVWREGLALGLGTVAVAGTVAAVFAISAPYFLTAIVEHHAMQGTELTVLQTVEKALRFYWGNIAAQPVMVGLAALGAGMLLWRSGRSASPGRGAWLSRSWPLWQVPTVLVFLGISRSLLARHLTYLAPAMVTLVAVALVALARRGATAWETHKLAVSAQGATACEIHRPATTGSRGQRWRGWAIAFVAMVGVMALSVAAVYPWAVANRDLYAKTDSGPAGLVATIREMSAPDELVMADYPALDFLAERRTTYWAAGISGGAAEGGQIRGEMLVEELEQRNVAMVLIDTSFWAHQFAVLHNYGLLRQYVQAHYILIDRMDWDDQELEVYARQDTMPYRPGAVYREALELSGARLTPADVASGGSLGVTLRWKSLAPMESSSSVSLSLVDASGRTWSQMEEPLLERQLQHTRKSKRWEPGLVVLQEHPLPVPATVPPGNYYLAARIYDNDSQQTLYPMRGHGAVSPEGELIVAPVRVLSP